MSNFEDLVGGADSWLHFIDLFGMLPKKKDVPVEEPKKKPTKRQREAKTKYEVLFPAASSGAKRISKDVSMCLDGYEITRLLGEGGFGVVFHAKNPLNPKKEYALKFQLLNKKHLVESWKKEVDIIKLFAARGVGPAFFGAWRCDDAQAGIIVNDLWDGELQRSYPLETWHIDHLEAQLRTIHSLGYVHGDLFPKNVLVRYTTPGDPLSGITHVTVADFGLTARREAFKEYDETWMQYHLDDVRDYFYAEPRMLDNIFIWKMRQVKQFSDAYMPVLLGAQCSVCLEKMTNALVCAGCKQVPFCGEECASRDARVKAVGGVGCGH